MFLVPAIAILRSGTDPTVVTPTNSEPYQVFVPIFITWTVDRGSDEALVRVSGGEFGGGSPTDLGTGSSGTISFTPQQSTTYLITIRATHGGANNYENIVVPVQVVLAGDGSQIYIGENFYVNWTISDESTDSAELFMSNNDGGDWSAFASQGTYSQGGGYTLSTSANYQFYIVVDGVQSNVVSVTELMPPSFNLDGDGTTVDDGTDYYLSWSASDGNAYNADIYLNGMLYSEGDASGSIFYATSDSTVSFYIIDNRFHVQSNTINVTWQAVAPTEPQSLYLNGDGDSADSGGSYAPTWSVDSGDDTANVYCNGGYVGTGSSGTVYAPIVGGSNPIFVQAVGGTNPSASITVNGIVPNWLSLTNPPDNSGFNNGDNVTVTWDVDQGADVADVYLYDNQTTSYTTIATGVSNYISFNIYGDSGNSFVITVQATYNSTASASVNVSII